MYMCRETVRAAVIEKFNNKKKTNIKTFNELQDSIDYTNKKEREEANSIINSLRICDPAVGSGHFLVSILNEIINIKSDLKILNYRDNKRILGYKIHIENDELIIINEETDKLFKYRLNQNAKAYWRGFKAYRKLYSMRSRILLKIACLEWTLIQNQC